MFKGLRPTPDLPPVWMAGFALVAWALSRSMPILRFDVAPAGRILIWIGIVLILWSAFWFWRKSTPIEPGHPPEALIVEGPYRINRNPIYTGLILILAGFALNLGAISALAPAIAYPWLLTVRFVRAEEAALRAGFGPAAEAFFARTRRW